MAGSASAELIGHWMFDEGSGDVAFDISGNGNDGTINGAQSVPGVGGSALEFDGVDDYVETPITDVPVDGTVAAWINTTLGDVRQAVLSSHNSEEFRLQLNYRPGTGGATPGFLGLNVLYGTLTAYVDIGSEMYDGSWHHVAFVWEGASPGTIRAYWDGQEKAVTYGSQNAWPGNSNRSAVHVIGREDLNNNNYFFAGQIDDVRMYDHALSEIEIQAVMNNAGGKWPFAFGPTPKDGALLVDTWISMSWGSGGFAASHDVYIGDNFDDVNDGTGDTFRGNLGLDTTFYIAGFPGYPYENGLVNGTTYYWRIDEVNDAEPNSPWKGDVWSFTIPPKSAYEPAPAEGVESVDLNVELSWTPGFGAKLHYIVFGEDFDEVNNAAAGTPNGHTTYTPGPLKLAKTYYWRVDEFDGAATHKGEVWSFTTEGAASGANPANGAVDVKPTAVLRWDAGVVAASHEVYFGADADAVKNATKSSSEYKGPKALGEESYDPGTLMLNTAYFWRIDEVNGASTDSPWAGNVWSFTTGDFFVIDDFEDYDAADNQIWYSWHDGLGYGIPGTADYFAGNGTGAAVGDETTASYTAETIVHGGGNQSMPVVYDNNKQGYSNYSEVDMTLTAQRDWTEEGMTELSLWFYGDSANAAEPLYVAIANTGGAFAVVIHDDAAAATIETWTQWIIPLQAFADQGISLTNIDRIAIGLGTRGNMTIPGGSGKMYFDDIRLNQPSEVAE